MIELNQQLLEEAGLAELPERQAKALLHQVYQTLEFRVGATLSGRMNDEQLKAFEAFVEADDQTAALQWLEQNVSDYREVVQQEFNQIRDELHESRKAICATFEEYERSALVAAAAKGDVAEETQGETNDS